MKILNVLILVVIIILNKCDNKITDTNHDSIYDNKDNKNNKNKRNIRYYKLYTN